MSDTPSDAESNESVDEERSEEERSLVQSGGPESGALLPLGSSPALDLSALPEAERNALTVEYAQGLIDVNKKAAELGVDVIALDNTLKSLSEATTDVSQAGDAITISHTQETSIGRTEIIMGNTDQAQSGKLTKTQTGERDWTPFYVAGGAVAVVVVVLAYLANA